MWKSRRGRALAREFAYDRLDIRGRIRDPLVLAAVQYAAIGAAGGHLTRQYEDFFWLLIGDVFQRAIDRKEVNAVQLTQLALTWKGTTSLLGWGGVRHSLPQPLRGRLACLFGLRLMQLGQPDEARKMLEQAAELPADDLGRRLAADAIQLLDQSAARVTVSGDLPAHQVVLLRDGESSPPGDLAPGTYRVELRGAGTAAPKMLTLESGRHYEIATLSHWPAAAPDPLAGLLQQPADLPNVGRWQIVLAPPAGLSSGALDDEGGIVATGPSNGIYDVSLEGEVVRRHAGPQPDRGTAALATASAGDIITVHDNSRLSSYRRSSGELLWTLRLPQWTNLLRWNESGNRLAAAAYGLVRVLSPDGGLLFSADTQLSPTALAWAPRERLFVVGGRVNPVAETIWRLQAWDSESRLRVWDAELPAAPKWIDWRDDGAQLAAATDQGVALFNNQGVLQNVIDGERSYRLTAYEPGGQHLWTQGQDLRLRRWSLTDFSTPVFESHLVSAPLQGLTFPGGEPVGLYAGKFGVTLFRLQPEVVKQRVAGRSSDIVSLGCSGVDSQGPLQCLVASSYEPPACGDSMAELKTAAALPASRLVACSPDGTRAAVVTNQHELQLLVTTDDRLESRRIAEGSKAAALDWHRDNRRLAVAASDALRVYDCGLNRDTGPAVADADKEAAATMNLPGRWHSVDWRPTGDMLAASDLQRAVVVGADGQVLFELPLTGGQAASVAWLADGQYLLVAQGSQITIWAPESPAAPPRVDAQIPIGHLAVLPEHQFAVGDPNGSVQIWDARDLAAPTRRLHVCGRLAGLASTREGSLLAGLEAGVLLEIPPVDRPGRCAVALQGGGWLVLDATGRLLSSPRPLEQIDDAVVQIERFDGTQESRPLTWLNGIGAR